MRFFAVLLSLCIIISCDTSTSNSDYSGTNYSNQESEQIHNEVEVVETGDVEIEDYIEEDNEPFDGNIEIENSTLVRLNELLNDNEYDRNNGKNNRRKIAKKMNQEGYRKIDGSKFRIKDIPK